MQRAVAAVLSCAVVFVLGFGTVFSFNLWAEWRPLSFVPRFADFGYFDVLDYLTANLMMPIGGLLLALFVGWRLEPLAPERTRVVFTLHLEPGGGVPAWMANARVVSTPFEALENLRARLARD